MYLTPNIGGCMIHLYNLLLSSYIKDISPLIASVFGPTIYDIWNSFFNISININFSIPI